MKIKVSQLRRIIREVAKEFETGDPARDLSGADLEDYRRQSVARAGERLGQRKYGRSETASEEGARMDKEYKDAMTLARQGDAAIARRDAEWKRGEPARKAAASSAASAEAAERKTKTLAAIKKYGDDYKTSKELPLYDVLGDIFVPGVRLKASEAIKASSTDLYSSLKGMSWEEALGHLEDSM